MGLLRDFGYYFRPGFALTMIGTVLLASYLHHSCQEDTKSKERPVIEQNSYDSRYEPELRPYNMAPTIKNTIDSLLE